MSKLIIIFIAALAVVSASALAQNAGPAPQSGMERPEKTHGATEKGSMDTTGMNVNRANQSETKDAAKGAAKKDNAKK
ncbi:hypothetical protein [Bradyrhizobium sp. NAS96.2]|uniref:hypothetical protein n=1 Tax=Bradyrhizobium sp. NAS96.2 TaxID=1680160 RepID=UPI00093F7FB6|nr:hypothetical protein [Bradyrhizobium sp. NAS96.2]OKO81150.1 hypothetical protein AC628_07240 [Bradyrhizobium sp. NAS96.2]